MAIRIPKPPLPGRRKPPPPQERTNGEVTVKDQAAEVGTGIVGWVDERTGVGGFTKGMLFRKVPKGTNWFYTLGSATLFAFLSQAVTGVILAMYYDPDPSARLRQRAAHHQRRVPRRASCAACTAGARR